MNWDKVFITVIQLAIFSIFITSIIEVVKGISGIGFLGLIKGLWNALIKNQDLSKDSFPVLNFIIALMCCWAFDIGIMKTLSVSISGSFLHQPWAGYIDYFGTASVTYLGSDQLFTRFLNVQKQAEGLIRNPGTSETDSKINELKVQALELSNKQKELVIKNLGGIGNAQ